jgi:membrane-bound inhibitor of C-type lysozyme
MINVRTRALPLGARIAAVAVLIAAASVVASSAYTRDSVRAVRYVCGNGERFSVEFLSGHIRLRTGAGIFALTGEPAEDATRYTDGRTAFWLQGEQAMLERPGLAMPAGCRPAPVAL